ncbi:MAG: Gfo/Idh/MocA family oxidoreductase [Sedimentisphaerales bacterium]|nr:Gfo/Idh/MocA family oxidoreductase [Sedimentisphaerales bacterium]
MSNATNRREFLKIGAMTGMGTAMGLSGCATVSQKTPRKLLKTEAAMIEYAAPPLEVIRVGYVGVGGMGTNHVKNLLKIEGVEVRAVCDIKPNRVDIVQKMVVKAGQKKPTGYTNGKTDFIRMCEREDLDLVYTATPWEWHVPVCVAAMKAGKHAATEIPAALTIEECWQLVETSEKTKKHCVMMENCCYDSTELIILNMIRKGLFGEILHAECGYMHDLRHLKLNCDKNGKPRPGEAEWRLEHSIKRNGNLYPPHGLGPIAQCLDINRGDRLDYLVSMSCNSRGLSIYAARKFGPDHRLSRQKYALGDVNTSLIRTALGKTITLGHDCDTPRPYSRCILVQGTNGIVRKYPEEKIHIEGKSKGHNWEPFDKYKEKYEHPLQKALKEKAKGAGHGGMDFIEDYRLINALRKGIVPDMDVYDAVTWSVVSELSEISVANRSKPVDFPDFTRGKWKIKRPLHLMEV